MSTDIIDEIRQDAYSIDPVLNLFDGYELKPFEEKPPELEFWMRVVNLYYIFKDCDNFQFSINNNLFGVFKKYRIISESDYERCFNLFHFVSDMRSWLCHNTNINYHFTPETLGRIKQYLTDILVEEKIPPEDLFAVNDDQWINMNRYIEEETKAYFNILKSSISMLRVHRKREQIVDKWKIAYAKGLYWNNEMKRNIIENIAVLQCLNENGSYDEMAIRNNRSYIEQELKNSYGYSDVLHIIKTTTRTKPSGYTIVKDCLTSLCFSKP